MSFNFDDIANTIAEDFEQETGIMVCDNLSEMMNKSTDQLNDLYRSVIDKVPSHDELFYIKEMCLRFYTSVGSRSDDMRFLTFWGSETTRNALKTWHLWIDGAAIDPRTFYFDSYTAYNAQLGSYYTSSNGHSAPVFLDFKLFMRFMESIQQFRQESFYSSSQPNRYQYFDIAPFIQVSYNRDDLEDFIKFCATYECNKMFPVKFTGAFLGMLITTYFDSEWELAMKVRDIFIKQVLSKSDFNIIEPKDFGTIIQEIIKDQSTNE